jgi:hypothetical protein
MLSEVNDDMGAALLNFSDYTPLALTFYCASAISWFAAYAIIIQHIRRRQFAPVPALAWCGFIAWEILWGYVYQTNVGSLFEWGLKIYAPLSCYILWGVFRYGHKQFSTRAARQNVAPIMLFNVVAWLIVLYFFIPAHDDPSGMTTATILSVSTSAQYLSLLLHLHEREGAAGLQELPYAGGWFKLMANTFSFIYCFLHLSERHWLLVLCVISVVLDLAYLAVFRHLRASARSHLPAKADSQLQEQPAQVAAALT